MYEHTAKLIKLARIKAGLTQEEFAKLLDIEGAQFVSNIERGTSFLPAKRAKKVRAIIGKEALLDAYIKDVIKQWIKDYAG